MNHHPAEGLRLLVTLARLDTRTWLELAARDLYRPTGSAPPAGVAPDDRSALYDPTISAARSALTGTTGRSEASREPSTPPTTPAPQRTSPSSVHEHEPTRKPPASNSPDSSERPPHESEPTPSSRPTSSVETAAERAARMAERARAEGRVDVEPITWGGAPFGPPLPPAARAVSFARRDARGPSKVAAKTTLPKTGTRRQDIVDVLHEHGPQTDDAIEQILDASHQSVSAARRGLVLDGYLEDRHEACHPACPERDDHRRPTRSGSEATVWHLTDSARRLLSMRDRKPVPEALLEGR